MKQHAVITVTGSDGTRYIWERKDKQWLPTTMVSEALVRQRCAFANYKGANQTAVRLMKQGVIDIGGEHKDAEWGMLWLRL